MQMLYGLLYLKFDLVITRSLEHLRTITMTRFKKVI